MKKLFLARVIGSLCLAAFVISFTAFGQTTKTKKPSSPTVGKSGASISVSGPTQVANGQTFTVELLVELGNSKYDDGSPALLGGYVIPVGFDPSVVELVGSDGGETPTFSRAPTVTDTDSANQKGLVIATAFIVNTPQAMSSLSVAKLTFRAKKAGAAIFTIDPQGTPQHAQLASQLHNKVSVSIPASLKNGAVTISNSKSPVRSKGTAKSVK